MADLTEKNGNGKVLNRPGFYKHEKTGQVVELDVTPDVGTPMIDAFVQAGFVPCEEEQAPVEDEAEKVVEPTKAEIVTELVSLGYDAKELARKTKAECKALLESIKE
jgi:hypothetical protein